MNKIISILITLFVFTSICYCANLTYKYLVYANKVNSTIINTIKSKGNLTFENTDGQPCRKTQVLFPSNTNYIIVFLAPKNQTEIDYIDNLISTSKVLKLGGYNPPYYIKYNDEPWDMDISWSVRVSTP